MTVSGEAWDPNGSVQSVEVRVGEGPWRRATGTTPWVYEWAATAPGTVTLACRAYDGVLYSELDEVTVTVVGTAIPEVLYLNREAVASALVATSSLLGVAIGAFLWRRSRGAEGR